MSQREWVIVTGKTIQSTGPDSRITAELRVKPQSGVAVHFRPTLAVYWLCVFNGDQQSETQPLSASNRLVQVNHVCERTLQSTTCYLCSYKDHIPLLLYIPHSLRSNCPKVLCHRILFGVNFQKSLPQFYRLMLAEKGFIKLRSLLTVSHK